MRELLALLMTKPNPKLSDIWDSLELAELEHAYRCVVQGLNFIKTMVSPAELDYLLNFGESAKQAKQRVKLPKFAKLLNFIRIFFGLGSCFTGVTAAAFGTRIIGGLAAIVIPAAAVGMLHIFGSLAGYFSVQTDFIAKEHEAYQQWQLACLQHKLLKKLKQRYHERLAIELDKTRALLLPELRYQRNDSLETRFNLLSSGLQQRAQQQQNYASIMSLNGTLLNSAQQNFQLLDTLADSAPQRLPILKRFKRWLTRPNWGALFAAIGSAAAVTGTWGGIQALLMGLGVAATIFTGPLFAGMVLGAALLFGVAMGLGQWYINRRQAQVNQAFEHKQREISQLTHQYHALQTATKACKKLSQCYQRLQHPTETTVASARFEVPQQPAALLPGYSPVNSPAG